MTVSFTRTVAVYTKPACVQACATYKALDEIACEFTAIDITVDDDAREYTMSLGYLQAPVVLVRWWLGEHLLCEDHWSGFRPDRIKALEGDVNRIGKYIARTCKFVAQRRGDVPKAISTA